MLGRNCVTVQKWLRKYRKGGLNLLLEPKTNLGGRESLIPPDFARTGRSLQTLAEADPFVSPELLEMVVNSYLPEGNYLNPIVSPIYADLSNLPPLLIHVGSQEILLDDSLRLATTRNYFICLYTIK